MHVCCRSTLYLTVNAEVEELVSIERWSVHIEVDWGRNHSLANH